MNNQDIQEVIKERYGKIGPGGWPANKVVIW